MSPSAYMVVLTGGEVVHLGFHKEPGERKLKEWELAGELIPLHTESDIRKKIADELRSSAFLHTDVNKEHVLLAIEHGGTKWHKFVTPPDDELEPLTPGLLAKMRASVAVNWPEDFKYSVTRNDTPVMPEEKPTGQVYGIIDPDYGRIYTMVRKLAWEEGYAIGLHGSFTRDLDLIAVPWEAGRNCKPEKLVARILQATGMTEARPGSKGNPGGKPFGRLVWTLLLPEFGDPRFVDLSIMPATVTRDFDTEIFAVARTLADRSADACNVDREDNWKQYGDDFRADAAAVLQAIVDGKAPK